MPVDLVSGIVQILGYNDITVGTGFIVSNSGLIATCAHVVQAAEIDQTGKLTVLFQKSGSKCSASVIRKWWSSPDNKDVAILELEHEIPEGVQVLPLGTSKGTDNHEVESFGFPSVGAIKEIRSKGTVYDRVTDKRGNPLLQIDSREITAGFSGSPLLDNSKQRVIGMIVSIAKEDPYSRLQTIAFAIPIETLQSICPTLKIEDICPYRGLLSFTEEDQKFFFGRDKLVQDLTNQLRSNPRFLALVGSSGSGKSSVISGGLLPRIRRGEIIGFENTQIVTFRPGIDPNQSLKREVDLFISTRKLDLWDGICLYLQKEPDKRLVIFADQFEELFTISAENEITRFIENLISLLESGLKVSLILTIRADFYSFLLESKFGKYLSTGQINVRSMSKEEIEQAIEKPAETIGLQIETGLTNLIITDLKDTKDPLPLLEFTLTKLWERRSDGLLTHNSYHKLGGVTGAIGQWANGTYGGFTDKEKELARRIFTRLIYYGERGTPDSRRRLPLKELAESEDRETIHKLITKLADVRLLVTDRELSNGIETVEIVHDSLLTEWRQLAEWIDEHHSFLLWRQQLDARINEWQMRGKDEGSLLRGVALSDAKKLKNNRELDLNHPEKEYINNSLKLEERQNRRKKNFMNGLIVVSVILLFLAGFSIQQWSISEENKNDAVARYLASQSEILQQDPTNLNASILLAIESFRIHRTVDADRLIHNEFSSIRSAVLMDNNESLNSVRFSPDGKYILTAGGNYPNGNYTARVWDTATGKIICAMKHDSPINDAIFSPDGKYIATVSSDYKARVWNAATGKLVCVMRHQKPVNDFTLRPDGGVNDIAYSPDGKYIATASSDNTSRIWDAVTGKQICLMKHEGSVSSVIFSPDGKYVATTSYSIVSSNHTVGIWNAAIGEQISVMKFNQSVDSVIVSPDCKYVVTESGYTARIWDINTGEVTCTIKHDGMPVISVDFSPDGKYIATASSDNTARIWNATSGDEICVVKHDGHVNYVAFSPDGKSIVTASDDDTARVWNATTGEQISVMKHPMYVYYAAYSRDGKHIVTKSEDSIARVWDTGKAEKTCIMEYNGSATAFSPDGKYIATVGSNNTAHIWNATSGDEICVVKHDGHVNDVAFSPDGKSIVTASDDDTARVWNAATGKQISVMKHNGPVNDVAFSSDGKYIATASEDIAQIWDTVTGKQISVMKHDGECIFKMSFSPNGKYLATSTFDTTRVWDTATGKTICFMKYNDSVDSITFSPDGKYLAAACEDNTAQIWNTLTGEQISVINCYGFVHSVAFSPDGKYIATASCDNTARLWNAATGKEIFVMKHSAICVSSIAFSPDGKYIATANENNVVIWDAGTGEQICLMKHKDLDRVIDSLSFSPDGRYLVTVGGDDTVKVWIYKTEDLINETGTLLTRNLTPEEWKKYMGNKPYHKTFPNLL